MRTSAHAHTYARNHTQSHTRTHKYARAHTYAQKMPLRAQRAPTRAFCGLFTHNNPQQIAKSAYGRRAAHPLARCAERMRGAARQTRREVPLLLLVSPALPASHAVPLRRLLLRSLRLLLRSFTPFPAASACGRPAPSVHLYVSINPPRTPGLPVDGVAQ